MNVRSAMMSATLVLGCGLLAPLASGAGAYTEPGYLNYLYPSGAEAAAPIQTAGGSAAAGSLYPNSLGLHEPGYLNYAYPPGEDAAPPLTLNGRTAAPGSVYSNHWGFVEPGYLNYGYKVRRVGC